MYLILHTKILLWGGFPDWGAPSRPECSISRKGLIISGHCPPPPPPPPDTTPKLQSQSCKVQRWCSKLQSSAKLLWFFLRYRYPSLLDVQGYIAHQRWTMVLNFPPPTANKKSGIKPSCSPICSHLACPTPTMVEPGTPWNSFCKDSHLFGAAFEVLSYFGKVCLQMRWRILWLLQLVETQGILLMEANSQVHLHPRNHDNLEDLPRGHEGSSGSR